jgi:hypothetical protein
MGEDDPITYSPSGGSDVTISAILDNTFIAVDPDTVTAVQSRNPRIGIRESEIVAAIGRLPDDGDKVTINTIVYRVIESQPDGRGDIKLLLHKDV